MQNSLAQLSRTVGVHAAMIRFAFAANHLAAAYWTLVRHVKCLMPTRMIFIIQHAINFWDDIAAALDLNPIADLHPQTFNLIHIMQSGATDGGATDRHRLQHCHGSQFAGPADLHTNVFNLRDAGPGRVFVGDRPARGFARVTRVRLAMRFGQL